MLERLVTGTPWQRLPRRYTALIRALGIIHVSSCCIYYMFCRCHSYGEGCDDIMLTCRHAWNAMLPILATPTNRAGLKGPGVTIISNVLKILGRNDGEVSGCGQWV